LEQRERKEKRGEKEREREREERERGGKEGKIPMIKGSPERSSPLHHGAEREREKREIHT